MKKPFATAILASSIALSANASEAEAKNICNSDSVVNNAKNKVFVIIEGPETKKNKLTYCRNGQIIMEAPVATGSPKHDGGVYTPEGEFMVGRLDKNKTSGSYKTPNGKRAPMPNAVHVYKGIWIHQGKVQNKKEKVLEYASHGCVRLDSKNSKKFYELMEQAKSYQEKIKVIIRGTNPKTPDKNPSK